MKRKEYKRIEAIAQEVLNAPTVEDEYRMEMIKQRAFEEYELRTEKAQKAETKPVTHLPQIISSLGQRLMTAGALALAFIVVPVVITMLFPAVSSTADGDWGRRVAIWLNNTLHTEIKVPESRDEQGGLSEMTLDEERVFYSLEEAAAFLDRNLLALGSEDVPCELQSITVSVLGEGIYRITEQYIQGNTEVCISLKTVLSSQMAAPHFNTTILQTSVGDLFVWEDAGECHAVGVYEDWRVVVSAKCNLSDAIALFSTVYEVN